MITVENAMIASFQEATLSPDPSTQLGAVLLSWRGNEIGRGHNSFTAGISDSLYAEREAKYPRICHAEVSAILAAARAGAIPSGGTLVCGWSACANCAKYVARAGVSELVRLKGFRDSFSASWRDDINIGDEILRAADVQIVEIPAPTWYGSLRMAGKTWTTQEGAK